LQVLPLHFDLFISYCREDCERVIPLVEVLRALGFSVFFDRESIKVGELWKRRLEIALRHSRALVLCWSAKAKASEFVHFEYTKADSLGKKVLPWLLDYTPLPSVLEVHGIAIEDPVQAAAALTRDLGWSLTRRRWVGGTAGAATAMTGLVIALRKVAKPSSFTFRGHVTDEKGAGVAGATVTAAGATVTTDQEGEFAMVLAYNPGSVLNLTITKSAYATREITADPTISDFGIVLEHVR
jgi:hypothetical protein